MPRKTFARRVAVGIGLALTALATLAGLTEDLPGAWSTWTSWFTPPDISRLELYALAFFFALLTLALVVPWSRLATAIGTLAKRFPYRIRLERTRSKKSIPTASPESINRLRELYKPVREALYGATTFLEEWVYGEKLVEPDRCRSLLRKAIREYPLESFLRARNRAESLIPKGHTISEEGFQGAIENIRLATWEYLVIVCWAMWLAEVYFGRDGLLRLEGFHNLRRRHDAMVSELEKVETRLDLGEVARHLNDLRGLLDIEPIPEVVGGEQSATDAPIEVLIEPGLNGVAIRVEQDRGHTVLEAFLARIRIGNNDESTTTLDKMWIEIAGKKGIGQPDIYNLQGNEEIKGGKFETFRLTYSQKYEGEISDSEWRGSVVLKIKTLRFGIVPYALPEHCFRFVGYTEKDIDLLGD